MSVLYLRARPMVAFDVTNPQHRRYFAEFVKYNTWGRCPVRFLAESLDMDLVSYINNKMLKYYVQQEFEIGKAKVRVKNKAKPKPKSTSGVVSSQHPVPGKKGGAKNSVSTKTQA